MPRHWRFSVGWCGSDLCQRLLDSGFRSRVEHLRRLVVPAHADLSAMKEVRSTGASSWIGTNRRSTSLRRMRIVCVLPMRNAGNCLVSIRRRTDLGEQDRIAATIFIVSNDVDNGDVSGFIRTSDGREADDVEWGARADLLMSSLGEHAPRRGSHHEWGQISLMRPLRPRRFCHIRYGRCQANGLAAEAAIVRAHPAGNRIHCPGDGRSSCSRVCCAGILMDRRGHSRTALLSLST